MLDYVSFLSRRYLTDALRENPVPRLKLSIMLSFGLDVFDELFPLELSRMLTHLTLCVVYANVGGPQSDADARIVLTLRWDGLLVRAPSVERSTQILVCLR